MKKIVTLTGHKYVQKDLIAHKLSMQDDNIEWIRPYVGIDLPSELTIELESHFNVVLPRVLERMMAEEKVLYSETIDDRTYVYFEFQMVNDINVLVVKDEGVLAIKENWSGETYSVFLSSEKQEKSEGVEELMSIWDFDNAFDVDEDDIDDLVVSISG